MLLLRQRGIGKNVLVPGRIGRLGHEGECRHVNDGKVLIPQGDQRTAQLTGRMVVVLSRLETVRPSDTFPQNGGIVGMAMPRKHTVHSQLLQLFNEAVRGEETADWLPLASEVTVLGGGRNPDDVLFLLVGGLVALADGGQMELNGGDMEAEEGRNHPTCRSIHAVNGGVEPVVLVSGKSGPRRADSEGEPMHPPESIMYRARKGFPPRVSRME